MTTINTFASRLLGGVLWRGQSEAGWGLSSTLWRQAARGDEQELMLLEAETLARAHMWGLGVHPAGMEPDHQVFATLQHHGANTRLMDVSADPMVALWFACQPPDEQDGSLFGFRRYDFYVLDTGGATIHLRPTYGSVSDPVGWHYRHALSHSAESGMPFVVRPTHQNPRIQVQSGQFLAWSMSSVGPRYLGGLNPHTLCLEPMSSVDPDEGGNPERALHIGVLVIPGQLKSEMRRVLKESHSIDRAKLFPDVQGLVESLEKEPVDRVPINEHGIADRWFEHCRVKGWEPEWDGPVIWLRAAGEGGLMFADVNGDVVVEFSASGSSRPEGWVQSSRPRLWKPGGGTWELRCRRLVDLDAGMAALSQLSRRRDATDEVSQFVADENGVA